MIIERQTKKLLMIYKPRAIMYTFFCSVNTDRGTNNINWNKWFHLLLLQTTHTAFVLLYQVDGTANRHQYWYWLSQRHYRIKTYTLSHEKNFNYLIKYRYISM